MQILISRIDEAAALADELPEPYLKKAREFSSPKRRSSFLAGRVLLQRLLKSHGFLSPLPALSLSEHGKPYLPKDVPWFFNITHSQGFIALAFGKCEQGIDLEAAKPRHDFTGVTQRVLTKAELAYIGSMKPDTALDEFTRLWTVRECLLKVTGRGLGGLSGTGCDPNTQSAWAAGCPEGSVTSLRFDALSERFPMWLTYFAQSKEEHAELSCFEEGKIVRAAPKNAATKQRMSVISK